MMTLTWVFTLCEFLFYGLAKDKVAKHHKGVGNYGGTLFVFLGHAPVLLDNQLSERFL